MNGAQLHLALNHFPVILSFTSLLVLIWGKTSKSPDIKKVGLALVILSAVFAGIAFLTGEPAEGILEKLPIFSKDLVHEHEEAGEAALIVSIIAGLAGLGAVWLTKKKHKLAESIYFICFVLVLMSTAAFFRTAHLGGLIRHEEIRTKIQN